MSIDPVDVPDGLTRRARSFIGSHCVRIDAMRVDQYRDQWLGLGIPAVEISRVSAYQRRWGGLVLPPVPEYNGGPRYLDADTPESGSGGGWFFEAGLQRNSVPYGFMIGPHDEFGIHGDRWVALHASVDGWVESVALFHHAFTTARHVTRLNGDDVEKLDLSGHDPVPEVQGVADTWWQDDDTLVALYTGEAECFASPHARAAYVYTFGP